jgi:hypothetical protein
MSTRRGAFPRGRSALNIFIRTFYRSAGAPVTPAADTSVAITLVIAGQKATAGEVLTLESYLVEIYKP